jgi:neutral amino acid transport system permease protein
MDWGTILSNTAAYLISPETIAYALAALGLAVHFGYTGLLNFGQAGFMAIGAYGYAISILRADYLAIVTIAAAEIVRLLFTTQAFDEYTNSADGLGNYHAGFRAANPIPEGTYGFGPWIYNENQWWVRIFGFGLVVLAALILWALMRSPWGRVIKGIREDEDAVRALGKNVFAYKMQSLVIGGIFGALGGVVLALPSAVVPSVYVTSLTFFLYTILLLGGAATVFGPIVGSIIFWVIMAFLSNALPALVAADILPFMSTTQSQVLRYILVGVALMLIVIFRPQGIFGNKKELTFVK